MGMLVDLAKGAVWLVGIGGSNHLLTVKEICDNFVQLPYEAARRTRDIKKGIKGIITKEFNGTIKSTSSNLDSRYLHSVVKKLNGATVVLTAICDRDKLQKEFENKSYQERGKYKLSLEDYPVSKDSIEGYHLLVIYGNEKAAMQINKLWDEKMLLDSILNATLQRCHELTSPEKAIEWLKDSDFRVGGSNPKGRFIFD